MGGDKARTAAVAQEPKPEPKVKNARGGYFGVGQVQQAGLLAPNTSKRATFLGA